MSSQLHLHRSEIKDLLVELRTDFEQLKKNPGLDNLVNNFYLSLTILGQSREEHLHSVSAPGKSDNAEEH